MTQSKRKGRPSSFEKKIIDEILKEFPVDGSHIRSKDLREKVGMSSRTLFNYLDYLCETLSIEKISVPSEKGKGVAYRKSKNINTTWDIIIERMREELIHSLPNDIAPHTRKFHTEYNQAFYLSTLIAVIDLMIVDSLRRYAKCDTLKRDAMFEHNLEVLKEMLRKMTSLCSKSIEMTEFTYILIRSKIPFLLMNRDPDNEREEFLKILELKKIDPEFAKLFDFEKIKV